MNNGDVLGGTALRLRLDGAVSFGQVIVDADITAAGDVSAAGNVHAAQDAVAQRFVVADGPESFVLQSGAGAAGSVLVGAGASNAPLSPELLIWDDSNARLGVGTNSPFCALDVVGDAGVSGTLYAGNVGVPYSSIYNGIRIGAPVEGNSAALFINASTYYYSSSSNVAAFIQVSDDANGSNVFGVWGDGSVRTTSNVLDDGRGNATFDGTVTAQGHTLTSDARLKEAIMDEVECLPLVSMLCPRTFVFKSDTSRRLRHGFLAQEVERVLPEIVYDSMSLSSSSASSSSSNAELYTLSYIDLTSILCKCVQELDAKVRVLESRIYTQSSEYWNT